ncbi:MAG: YmdB family metallophosphoesterase [Opitutales bacterium]|nr:YmdB family metallophosphoesterase [Opitutales bacterium]
MPRLLFLGDIVGRPGRSAVIARLRALRADLGADWVVANAENAAGGSGLNASIARDLAAAGVDAITLGDHCWDQRGFDREIGALEHVCRPANLPAACPGRTHIVLENDGFRLAVFTLLGNQFMKVDAEHPFRAVEAWLDRLRKEADAVFLEFHAETTSEKIAMGWFLDGRAAAVVGTHTHVPTADARILPRGTAYITDVGMSGPYASVLGREIAPILARMSDGMPRRFPVAAGDVRICGVVIDIDPGTCRATSIKRIEIPAE